MQVIKIKRRTRYEKRYSRHMGKLITKVTYIKKHVMGVPVTTLHKYRETYYGEIKDCKECQLSL